MPSCRVAGLVFEGGLNQNIWDIRVVYKGAWFGRFNWLVGPFPRSAKLFINRIFAVVYAGKNVSGCAVNLCALYVGYPLFEMLAEGLFWHGMTIASLVGKSDVGIMKIRFRNLAFPPWIFNPAARIESAFLFLQVAIFEVIH